jgi:hypothetical protein
MIVFSGKGCGFINKKLYIKEPGYKVLHTAGMKYYLLCSDKQVKSL